MAFKIQIFMSLFFPPYSTLNLLPYYFIHHNKKCNLTFTHFSVDTLLGLLLKSKSEQNNKHKLVDYIHSLRIIIARQKLIIYKCI